MEYHVYGLLKQLLCLFLSKNMMERLYLQGIFEQFMIFQDSGNMFFGAANNPNLGGLFRVLFWGEEGGESTHPALSKTH